MQVRTFPPDVFARLAPNLYFQRYWDQNSRPTGREKDEWRQLVVKVGGQDLEGSIGSAVVRAGDATVLCGITGSITGLEGEGGVYANVELRRGGRDGVPSIEEQCLSYAAHRLVATAAIPQTNFIIEASSHKELVLNASILVLSRTGPCMDLVWEALVAALKDTRIPEFEEDAKTGELVPIRLSDRHLELPVTLPKHHRTMGVYENQLLADIDGPTEEQCVPGRISVACTENGRLAGFSLTSSSPVSVDKVKEALHMARLQNGK